MVRVARYGDCAFREMVHSHGGIGKPIGYPRYAAEELVRHGVGMEFANVFAVDVGALPVTREALLQHLRLKGEPDAVVIHVGQTNVWRTIIENGRRMVAIRDRLARWSGPMLPLAYRLLDPILRRAGKLTLGDPDLGRIESLIENARALWPAARIAVVEPHRPRRDGVYDDQAAHELSASMREICRRKGIDYLETDSALHDSAESPWAANGYNLNEHGSAILGNVLARWLEDVAAEAERDRDRGQGAPQ